MERKFARDVMHSTYHVINISTSTVITVQIVIVVMKAGCRNNFSQSQNLSGSVESGGVLAPQKLDTSLRSLPSMIAKSKSA